MSKSVIIIGASGHGKVVADVIRASGDDVYGFLDDDTLKEGVIGPISACTKYLDKWFVIAIGNNKIRRKIAEKYQLNYYTAIHPTATVSDSVNIGQGTVVMAKAVINADSVIGKHCIINTASVVEHDNLIEDYVHISPNATLCGTVFVGENSHIGAGVVVKNNIKICSDITVGIGAAVVSNIEKKGIYVGIPAKELS